MKLAQLAAVARADLDGDGEVEIERVALLAEASPRALVFVADARRLADAEASAAGALLVPLNAPPTRKPALRAANPRAAFARVLAAFAPPAPATPGVHPTAVVASDARLAADVAVGPHAVVDHAAVLGPRSVVGAGAVIGARCRLGADCRLHPRVVLYPDTVLGDRVVIHSGAVIGGDGFGYAADGAEHVKIPQLGRVVIGDDVEIGANTTIDRATLGETRIGPGTKIDNLVQIGHNVVVGARVLIVAQVGISGSVTIGDDAIIAGQAGVRDHVTIGAGARVLGQAGVTKDVPAGATVSGYPARPHREALRLDAAAAQLPELLERVRALERPAGGSDPAHG